MRLLIFCNHFYPAYKGGGPIQSIINLVELLPKDIEIFVVASARDLGESSPLPGVNLKEWNDFRPNCKVFYVDSNFLRQVRLAFENSDPHFVYVNGMFSIPFNAVPIILARLQKRIVIISPRGMLQRGALLSKPVKKRIFLFLFKLCGFHQYSRWHATDKQEVADIRSFVNSKVHSKITSTLQESAITLAFDTPKAPINLNPRKTKKVGYLNLVYLSLISEKKNLHLVIEALQQINSPIQFHIYGPIKDKFYWERVQNLMKVSKHEIQYFGSIDPSKVQNTLAHYDAMILPTKGENFGHAIYESLGAGTPVILSQYTPWGRLQDYQAGLTVESFEPSDWAAAIEKFTDMDEDEYNQLSKGAYLLATDYFSKNDFASQYQALFS